MLATLYNVDKMLIMHKFKPAGGCVNLECEWPAHNQGKTLG